MTSQPCSKPTGCVTLTAAAFAGLRVFAKLTEPLHDGRSIDVCWSLSGAQPDAVSSFTVYVPGARLETVVDFEVSSAPKVIVGVATSVLLESKTWNVNVCVSAPWSTFGMVLSISRLT